MIKRIRQLERPLRKPTGKVPFLIADIRDDRPALRLQLPSNRRLVGPTLQSFGVSGNASQTSLTVYNGATIISSNSGWTTSPNAAVISTIGGPFPLIVGSQESAVLATLNPGNYTAQATANGAVLLEVYEAP